MGFWGGPIWVPILGPIKRTENVKNVKKCPFLPVFTHFFSDFCPIFSTFYHKSPVFRGFLGVFEQKDEKRGQKTAKITRNSPKSGKMPYFSSIFPKNRLKTLLFS
jgi:hypothetical protein